MDTPSEGISKEIPAQQQTVNAIASGLQRFAGRKIEQYFRVGGAESGTTLELSNALDLPWRQSPSGRIHPGKEITLVERKDILGKAGVETTTEITPFFLDTSGSTPRLLIDTDDTDHYEGGFPDAAFMRRTSTRHQKSFDKKWKTTNEDQAQKLLTAITQITTDDELENINADHTKSEKLSRDEIFRQISAKTARIFEAAESTDYGIRDEVSFRLSNKIVMLGRNKHDGKLRISVTEPLSEDNNINQNASENYLIEPGVNIWHNTTFTRDDEHESTSNSFANEEQTDYLLAVLENVSVEKVKAELLARKAIRDNVDRILTAKGQQEEDFWYAEILKENYSIDIIKSAEGAFPYTSVIITNADEEISDEDYVIEQNFILAGTKPLEVRTQRYRADTEEEEDETEVGITNLATEDQTTYVKTVLEEAA